MLINIPLNCPTIILRYFNVNMLVKTSKSTMLNFFWINIYLKLLFLNVLLFITHN